MRQFENPIDNEAIEGKNDTPTTSEISADDFKRNQDIILASANAEKLKDLGNVSNDNIQTYLNKTRLGYTPEGIRNFLTKNPKAKIEGNPKTIIEEILDSVPKKREVPDIDS